MATLKMNPGYDSPKDFAPIIRTTTTAMVLPFKPDFAARDLPQSLDYTRAHKNLTGAMASAPRRFRWRNCSRAAGCRWSRRPIAAYRRP